MSTALVDGLNPDSETTLPWREWLALHFASYTTAPFAERHIRFWEWISALQPGVKPRARVEIWPRGGGKSATTELGCAYLGSSEKPRRNFVLYVSRTQGQADKHVQAIANMLLRAGAQPAKTTLGTSKGWRREQVRTANGFNIASFGLDAGMRGARLDEFRPDLIIFDDVDGRHDTPAATQKNIDIITETILPSGSVDCAVIFVQNLIHEDSIASQLADGRADFLHGRDPAVVEPAVRDMEYVQEIDEQGRPYYRITGGTATWEGQDLATCERQLNDWGVSAFAREANHEVEIADGGLWNKARDIDPFRVTDPKDVPPCDVVVVGVDPNASTGGDRAGIVVAGISGYYNDSWWQDPHAYVLADRSIGGGPKAWAEEVALTFDEFDADLIIAEINNGGDMVEITLRTVDESLPIETVHASKGKITRATPVQKLYEDGRVHHVRPFPRLEKQMCRWRPGTKQGSPDEMDALVWALTYLMLDRSGSGSGSVLSQYLARQ